MKRIILASSSPRRKEIFAKLGLPFDIVISDFEEDMSLDMPPGKLAEHLSEGKAMAVSRKHPDALVIAADTLIAYHDQVLGKPITAERAKEMLNILQGKEHQIITGVTIVDGENNKSTSFHEAINVWMKKMTEKEIDAYIKTGEPLDKAGAYALQERGAVFIKRIDGDFFAAMGLPLSRLVDELRHFSFTI